MIGIYKITNKLNGKVYIGQSDNCERRIKEHKRIRSVDIDDYINVLGADNFTYEIIKECEKSELDSLEQFYIQQYDSKNNGYNIQKGGYNNSSGEGNGRARLTEEEVIIIRKAYANHEKQRDIYNQFKDKISWGQFQGIWQGLSWTYIMPEVYTEENKLYYTYYNCVGENSPGAAFTNEEVLKYRKEYVNLSAKEIYEKYNLSDRIKYPNFQKTLWGAAYNKDVPVYKKKEKQWYLNNEPVSTISESGE